jgi:cell division protein ZapA
VEVEIYGERYAIRGSADEQLIGRVAALVDREMREVAQNMRTTTPTKLAVLAALNLAHRLVQLEDRHNQQEAAIDRRAFDLMESIEAQLGSVKAR